VNYYTYLRSPLWEQKRADCKQQAIDRHGNDQCERCRLERGAEAHHLTYKFFKWLPYGAEPVQSLLWVCRRCHAWIHKDKTGATVDPAYNPTLDEIYNLCCRITLNCDWDKLRSECYKGMNSKS
jgi:hypothetical protein